MAEKPVKKIEVDTGRLKLRGVLAAVFLVIALVSIGYGVSLLMTKDQGWQQVEISSNEPNCSGDFVFNYCFGQGEISATEEYRRLNMLYKQYCEEGYQLFSRETALAKLTPNTPVEVEEALYNAFAQIQEAKNRSIYLAPVYDEYQRIFLCQNEEEAALYDPAQDPQQAQYLGEIAAYCNDPEMIDLELLGDNRVCLRVSDAYLQYARQMEITEFLDFGWMKNGFVIDYMAGKLIKEGFTHGYLVSYDGFTRNLDESGQAYSLNIFDRQNKDILKAGVMHYEGPLNIVQLRDFPMVEEERWHYYTFSDGHITSVYTDPADGMTKCAVSQLVSYSKEMTCTQILLEIAPVYLSGQLQEDALNGIAQEGIYSVWCTENALRYNQKSLNISQLDSNYTAQYMD